MITLITLRSTTRTNLIRSIPSTTTFSSFNRFNSTSTPSSSASASTSTSTSTPENTLVILGGGLSGLSSAFYFLQSLSPKIKSITKVIILEKQARTGGWCHSVEQKQIDGVAASVNDNGSTKSIGGKGSNSSIEEVFSSDTSSNDAALVFETGPRSIRPVGLQGWLTVDMAHTIGLTPQILTVAKTAPSAKNRFVYYPDRLTLLPSSLSSALKAVFTVPLIRSVIPGVLAEPFRFRSKLHKREDGGDESVDSFFKRRFGKKLAERMISSMIHGIYSGDTRYLSMRVIFPGLWEAEREMGSVILYALFGSTYRKYFTKSGTNPYQIKVKSDEAEMNLIKSSLGSREGGKELIERMELASVWGVKGGLEKLTDKLRDWLIKTYGVEVRTGEGVEEVKKVGDLWSIKTPSSTLLATHLIATLPSLLPSSLAPPTVQHSTVSVLNLAYSTSELESKGIEFPKGFGYLIPRVVKRTRNPMRALGVIFDSDVMPEVDSSTESVPSSPTTTSNLASKTEKPSTPSEKLTKFSILSGGAYWLPKNGGPPSPLPTHDQLLKLGQITLNLHFPSFRGQLPNPTHSMSNTHLDCIAQCPPYHHLNMRELGNKLRGEGVEGRVGVVGGEGVSGVGVNGAVRGAWEVGSSWGRKLSEGKSSELVKDGKGEKVRVGTEMWE